MTIKRHKNGPFVTLIWQRHCQSDNSPQLSTTVVSETRVVNSLEFIIPRGTYVLIYMNTNVICTDDDVAVVVVVLLRFEPKH